MNSFLAKCSTWQSFQRDRMPLQQHVPHYRASPTISPAGSRGIWRTTVSDRDRPLHHGLQTAGASGGESLSLDSFYQLVADREGVAPTQAAHHARAVITVLQEALDSGELEDLKSQLPESYRPLFQKVDENARAHLRRVDELIVDLPLRLINIPRIERIGIRTQWRLEQPRIVREFVQFGRLGERGIRPQTIVARLTAGIGIRGRPPVLPFPHHRTYGSHIRRFEKR